MNKLSFVDTYSAITLYVFKSLSFTLKQLIGHFTSLMATRKLTNHGGYLTKFYTGRLHPEFRGPLPFLYHFCQKSYPFHICSIEVQESLSNCFLPIKQREDRKSSRHLHVVIDKSIQNEPTIRSVCSKYFN